MTALNAAFSNLLSVFIVKPSTQEPRFSEL
jgi:hypothetical protein